MKPQYMNINRIEFIVTWQCGGGCKHCQIGSEINKRGTHSHVIAKHAAEAVKNLASVFDITSVMTFGGEPLYYADVTATIHKAATDSGVAKRQIITNGYFTNRPEKSKSVAETLAVAGVNSLLLSVDAFHQERIPIEPVRRFAQDVANAKIPGAVIYPAWLVDASHENPYNARTRELLAQFEGILPISGYENQIAPLGDAAKWLREYYEQTELDISSHTACSEPLMVTNISIVPNGDMMVCGFAIGNIYEEDALDIVARYNPHEHEGLRAVVEGGVSGLLEYAKRRGIEVSPADYCDICGLCEAVARKL